MTHNREIPRSGRLLTPQRMGEMADSLSAAAEQFRAWDVRVHEAGRVADAIRLLRSVAEVGRFPEPRSELIDVAHAAIDAHEFTQVAWVLPRIKLQPVAERLKQAMSGVLGGQATAPFQSQSELWIGAMLAHSGAVTGIIDNGIGKRPDYVLRNGALEYSVEVKRPTGNLKASKLISEAKTQVGGSRYHGSGLVVDLTDCMGTDLTVRFAEGPPEADWGTVRLETLTQALLDQIVDASSKRLRQGREHIFSLVTLTRLIHWDRDDLSQLYIDRKFSHRVIFGGSAKNLRAHRAHWLARLVSQGMERVGYHLLREEAIGEGSYRP